MRKSITFIDPGRDIYPSLAPKHVVKHITFIRDQSIIRKRHAGMWKLCSSAQNISIPLVELKALWTVRVARRTTRLYQWFWSSPLRTVLITWMPKFVEWPVLKLNCWGQRLSAVVTGTYHLGLCLLCPSCKGAIWLALDDWCLTPWP